MFSGMHKGSVDFLRRIETHHDEHNDVLGESMQSLNVWNNLGVIERMFLLEPEQVENPNWLQMTIICNPKSTKDDMHNIISLIKQQRWIDQSTPYLFVDKTIFMVAVPVAHGSICNLMQSMFFWSEVLFSKPLASWSQSTYFGNMAKALHEYEPWADGILMDDNQQNRMACQGLNFMRIPYAWRKDGMLNVGRVEID